MSPFVDDLLVAASASIDQFQDGLSDLVEALPVAGRAERDAALHRLAAALSHADPSKAALLALGCGAVVEHGADPLIAMDAILARLPAVLTGAARYRDAWLSDRTGNGEPPPFFFRDESLEAGKAERGTRADDAWDALDLWCRAAIALLARSPEVRARARRSPALRGLVEPLTGDHDYAAYLAEILDVLDEDDVIVLHPEERLGFRVRICGIADNFQFHTLLAAALIGDPFDGWISGRPVPARVAAAARDRPASDELVAEARFNLFQWRALQPDRTLPTGLDGSDHWLWPEGRPADMELFEGTRVVLLGPPAYVRTWNAARRFDAMAADLTVVEKLDCAVVDEWLRRIAEANDHDRT